MKLYCRTCEDYTEMEDAYIYNFICMSCENLLLGENGYEIYEIRDGIKKLCHNRHVHISCSTRHFS